MNCVRNCTPGAYLAQTCSADRGVGVVGGQERVVEVEFAHGHAVRPRGPFGGGADGRGRAEPGGAGRVRVGERLRAGVGDGPTGKVGRPVARGADKGPIPSDIDEGLNPANETAPPTGPAAKPTTIPARSTCSRSCEPSRSIGLVLLM